MYVILSLIIIIIIIIIITIIFLIAKFKLHYLFIILNQIATNLPRLEKQSWRYALTLIPMNKSSFIEQFIISFDNLLKFMYKTNAVCERRYRRITKAWSKILVRGKFLFRSYSISHFLINLIIFLLIRIIFY